MKSPPRDPAEEPKTELAPVPPPRRRLSFAIRVAIFLLGWAAILIGVAGLVLPGIQGVLTIVFGATLLSLDNELIYRGLRRLFARWPHLLARLEGLRDKLHRKLHSWSSRD